MFEYFLHLNKSGSLFFLIKLKIYNSVAVYRENDIDEFNRYL